MNALCERGVCQVKRLELGALGGGGVELLGGESGGGSGYAFGVLVLVFELRVNFVREIGLALAGVEFGEFDLGESGGDGVGGVSGELVVEVDGLSVATGLVIEVGESFLGKRGELFIPAIGDFFQGGLGGGGLTLFEVGEAGEIAGVLAGCGHAVLVGDGEELGVGCLGAFRGGVVGFDAGIVGLAGG